MAGITASAPGQADLAHYLREIRAFPILTPEQELAFAQRWHEHGDIAAVHALVNSHLRLVAKLARGYRGYGLPLDDLIAEGSIGMLQAAKRFDPARGVRLAPYAVWWIRASMQEYILRSWSLVKMGTTAAQKKLFFNLRRIKGQLSALEEGDLSPAQVKNIAHRLDVAEQEVVQMNRRLAAPDQSLNAPLRIDGDGQWQDWLVDERMNQEAQLAATEELDERKAQLSQAMEKLNEREKRILAERRLKDEPTTLEELSAEFGVSRERIRQIEIQALDKLRDVMASPRAIRLPPVRREPASAARYLH